MNKMILLGMPASYRSTEILANTPERGLSNKAGEAPMFFEINPRYPDNGNLRMYNMFPYRRYTDRMGMEGMIEYLKSVASMGYNAVWLNPVQAIGTKRQPHPDGKSDVDGSLYAMADDKAFNPLVFPGCESPEACEEVLRRWTASARLQGMYPLFDLVLNHVGVNEGGESPLQTKLAEKGLLLNEVNERWPDIKGIDYYKEGSTKRGLDAGPADLDEAKINQVFELLWEPFIRRYIEDYGFMGARVDALTHVPVPVQQRAHHLIQTLVLKRFETQAIVVGEVMVSNADHYINALKTCQLTHCFNPYSFYWGHNMEGGYANSHELSAFLRQNHRLSAIVEAPKIDDTAYKLQLLSKPYDAKKHTAENTFYVYKDEYAVKYVLTGVPFIEPIKGELSELGELGELGEYVSLYEDYYKALQGKNKNEISGAKNAIESTLSTALAPLKARLRPQLNAGGLVGVVGNHDVGTLKAKVMLDIAYSRAMSNAGDNQTRRNELQETYKWFKSVGIKAIVNTDDLIGRLQSSFGLSGLETLQLFAEVNTRMREKLFIQAMSCAGGYYSMAGDELGVCHKPEVFRQFAQDDSRVGSALVTRAESKDHQHDLRDFIRGMNQLLALLPHASLEDTEKTTLHYHVLEPEVFGEKSADFLFLVVRYNSKEDAYYLLGHATKFEFELHTTLADMIGHDHPCFKNERSQLMLIDNKGGRYHPPRLIKDDDLFETPDIKGHKLATETQELITPSLLRFGTFQTLKQANHLGTGKHSLDEKEIREDERFCRK